MSSQFRSYDVARTLFGFLEFLGWAVVALGILAGFGLAASAGSFVGSGQKFMLFISGASFSLVGLFLVGSVQNWRAGVDTAEYNQQILQIARDQLQVSKQALKQPAPQSFAAAAAAHGKSDAATPIPSQTVANSDALPDRHRGHNIYRVGASFKALGQVFDSHGGAMAAIDQKLDALPALGSDITVSTAGTEDASHLPSPAGQKQIEERGGVYSYGRMEFASREAAERYVAQLGVNKGLKT